jgi:molybdopterin synthase catalytic subunit
MERQICLMTGPIPPPMLELPQDGTCGAVVDFFGMVRLLEDGRELTALSYTAYEAMARQEFDRILDVLAPQHPVLSVHITHSLGTVPAGHPSLHVRVRAQHRSAAFSLAAALIDRMKETVPIWKKPVFPAAADPGQDPSGPFTAPAASKVP